MKLTVNYTGTTSKGELGPKTASVDPSPEAIVAAAKKVGYQEKVPDPKAARDYELKMAEVLAAEPGSDERATLQAEANALQAKSRQLVDNPMSREEFVVVHVRKFLASLLVDETVIQQAANDAAVAAQQAAELKAAGDLQLKVEDDEPAE